MLVSIIVPIFNSEHSLHKCINSLTTQQYKNLEIILINDGSTDDSRYVCDEASNLDSRIVVVNQKNLGCSVARNRGLKVSKGEYILFVDSDDYLPPNAVTDLVDSISNSNCGQAIGSYTTVLLNEEIEVKRDNLQLSPGKRNLKDILSWDNRPQISSTVVRCKHHELTAIWGKLYISSIIKNNNLLFQETLSKFEDIEFNISYLKLIDSAVVIESTVYYYTVNISTDRTSLSDQTAINWTTMLDESVKRMELLCDNDEMTYVYQLYSTLYIGSMVRIFSDPRLTSFYGATQHLKCTCKSKSFQKCLKYYSRPPGGSVLFVLLIKHNLFLCAGFVAKIRMLQLSNSRNPIRRWCFSD